MIAGDNVNTVKFTGGCQFNLSGVGAVFTNAITFYNVNSPDGIYLFDGVHCESFNPAGGAFILVDPTCTLVQRIKILGSDIQSGYATSTLISAPAAASDVQQIEFLQIVSNNLDVSVSLARVNPLTISANQINAPATIRKCAGAVTGNQITYACMLSDPMSGLKWFGNAFLEAGSLNMSAMSGVYEVLQDGVYNSSMGPLVPYQANAINGRGGTTYTIQASDSGKLVERNNNAGVTATLPSTIGPGFRTTLANGTSAPTTLLGPRASTSTTRARVTAACPAPPQ